MKEAELEVAGEDVLSDNRSMKTWEETVSVVEVGTIVSSREW